MFRASLCPSSGALDRILLHMVFITRCAGREAGRLHCVEDVVGLVEPHPLHSAHGLLSSSSKTPDSASAESHMQ